MYEQNNNMQQQFQNLNQQGTGMNPNMQQPSGMSANPSQPVMYQQQYSAPTQNVSGIDENAWFETEGLVTESSMVLDRSGNPVQGINDKGPWMKWLIKLQTNEGTKTMSMFRKADTSGQWLAVPITGNYIKASYKCKENPKYPSDIKRAYKTLMKYELLNTNQHVISTGQQPSQSTLTNHPSQYVNPSNPNPVLVPVVNSDKIRELIYAYVQTCTKQNKSFNKYELIGLYYHNKLPNDPLVKELVKLFGEICG